MNREREQGAASLGDPLPEAPLGNGVACPLAPSAETGGCGLVDQKGCASCEDVQCAGTCQGTVSRLGCGLRCCLHAGHESKHWCKRCWRIIQDPVGRCLYESEHASEDIKETQTSFVQAVFGVFSMVIDLYFPKF